LLNEREIRAAAGLLFVPMLIALMLILLNGDFLMIKYYIIIFNADLLIRVFISPQYAPSLILGRLIVSRQTPEYVAAAQKYFAWKIGIGLSSLMLFLIVILNTYSIFTGLSCLFCLLFLFFETAFGICLGCVVYGWFNKNKMEGCAGEACERKEKEEIQKISGRQVIILLAFLLILIIGLIFFKGIFVTQPRSLFSQNISTITPKIFNHRLHRLDFTDYTV